MASREGKTIMLETHPLLSRERKGLLTSRHANRQDTMGLERCLQVLSIVRNAGTCVGNEKGAAALLYLKAALEISPKTPAAHKNVSPAHQPLRRYMDGKTHKTIIHHDLPQINCYIF